MSSFPCTGCGMCCNKAGVWVKQAKKLVASGDTAYGGAVKEVAEFPHACSPEGRCSKLDENNQCSIYDTRPLICSIERTWEKYHKDEMTLEEYYRRAATNCNIMITEAGMDKKFLVEYAPTNTADKGK